MLSLVLCITIMGRKSTRDASEQAHVHLRNRKRMDMLHPGVLLGVRDRRDFSSFDPSPGEAPL